MRRSAYFYRTNGYPIIGGPLDGQLALLADFYRGWGQNPGGKFQAHRDEYVSFNRASRSKDVPTMIWLHTSLLP